MSHPGGREFEEELVGRNCQRWCDLVENAVASASNTATYLPIATDLPPRPSTWDDAGPWCRALDSVVRGYRRNPNYELSTLLRIGNKLNGPAWAASVSNLISKLLKDGAISPDLAKVHPTAVIRRDDARAQVLEDGDVDLIKEFDRLRNSVPCPPPPTRGLPEAMAETVIAWASAGIVGNFAWSVVRQWISTKAANTQAGTLRLEPSQAQAFAELYLDGAQRPPGDVFLVGLTERRARRRAGRRQWVETSEWHFSFVSREREYSVSMEAEPGSEFPVLAQITESFSPTDRFESLLLSGTYLPANLL